MCITRTVQRKKESERWAADPAEMASAVSWRTSPDDEDADGRSVKA